MSQASGHHGHHHEDRHRGHGHNRGHDHEHEILLHVSTPAGVFHGVFPKTAKVSEVIAAIVEDKGLDASEDLKLYNGDEEMAPQRTLASYHLGHEAHLSLLATGSGV